MARRLDRLLDCPPVAPAPPETGIERHEQGQGVKSRVAILPKLADIVTILAVR